MTKKAITADPAISAPSLFQQGKFEKEITPRVDFDSLLEKATKNIGGRLGIFSEPVWNSEDAEASNIWITVENEKDPESFSITILDNGKGMGPRGRQSFMDVAMSLSKEKGFKRGRHGLGVKRMKADFKFCEIVDISADEKDDKMRVISFPWNDWLLKLQGDKSVSLAVNTLPRDPVKIGLPRNSTGVRIRLWGPQGRFYSISEVIDTLATYLAPWLAKKILVSSNGQKWLPLKTREFIGERIEYEETHPTLGRIIVNLYLPKSTTEGDALRIGAIGPVCDFKDFKSYFPEHLRKRLPDVLDNPIVNGLIDVARFNEFSDAYRKSFDVSLFETPMMRDFVDFLEYQLSDQIEEKLGMVQDELSDEMQSRLMEEVAQLCNVLGGERTAPVPQERPLILSVKNIEVLRGQKVAIAIRRHSTTIKKFEWDDTRSGGSIDTDEGKQVVYTAGDKVGEYELTCFDADRAETRATVNISIVPKFQLRISPSQATLEVGESITLHAKNVEDDSSGAANLRWRSDEPEGKFDATRGDIVTYTAGYQEGTYLITVYDRKKESKQATAVVTVVKERPERARKDDDSSSIVIEGIRYKLRARNVEKSPFLSWKAGDVTTKFVEIHINWKHSVLRQALEESRPACRQILIRQVLFHHLEIISDELQSPKTINDKMASLHEKIAQRLMEKD